MKRKDVALLGVAVCCLAGAVLLLTRSVTRASRDSDDFPDGTFFVCQDCKHEFVKSVDEVVEIKAAARAAGDPSALQIPCASCGSRNTTRGLRCPSCTRIFLRQGPGQPICPYCNKPLPPTVTAEGG